MLHTHTASLIQSYKSSGLKLHLAEIVNNGKLTELCTPHPTIDKFLLSVHERGPL
jgi:hypothetical protein